MAETAATFIDGRGGAAALAERVRRSPGAVRVWRHRNRIPRDAWPEIIAAFPDVTMAQLVAIESAAGERPSKDAA